MRRNLRSAFTLMELMLALSILVLVAGCIYAMIDASLRTTAAVDSQQERLRVKEALTEFLRHGFANLPPKARLTVFSHDEKRGGTLQELRLRDAPGVWGWGRAVVHSGSVGLNVVSGADGLLALVLDRFIRNPYAGEASTERVRLAGGIRFVDWTFFHADSGRWVSDWYEEELPSRIRLRWQLQGEDEVMESLFDVPASRAKEP